MCVSLPYYMTRAHVKYMCMYMHMCMCTCTWICVHVHVHVHVHGGAHWGWCALGVVCIGGGRCLRRVQHRIPPSPSASSILSISTTEHVVALFHRRRSGYRAAQRHARAAQIVRFTGAAARPHVVPTSSRRCLSWAGSPAPTTSSSFLSARSGASSRSARTSGRLRRKASASSGTSRRWRTVSHLGDDRCGSRLFGRGDGGANLQGGGHRGGRALRQGAARRARPQDCTPSSSTPRSRGHTRRR